MSQQFKTIGLFAKHNSQDVLETLISLVMFLKQRQHDIILEEECARFAKNLHLPNLSAKKLGGNCDLIIVVGGDGSLLKAARSIVEFDTPVLGVNRGRLGFLADIHPEQFSTVLNNILDGSFISDERSLLELNVMANGQSCYSHIALNDVVLYPGTLARMIEFELFIDDKFVIYQRSDGLITATPTGSTAYALSAGGPILHPYLNAITLVPMFPHTLSSRPIVISDESIIKLVIPVNVSVSPKVSCDGQEHEELSPGNELIIKCHDKKLKLIHPLGYNYYSVLREKLGWNSSISSDR